MIFPGLGTENPENPYGAAYGAAYGAPDTSNCPKVVIVKGFCVRTPKSANHTIEDPERIQYFLEHIRV